MADQLPSDLDDEIEQHNKALGKTRLPLNVREDDGESESEDEAVLDVSEEDDSDEDDAEDDDDEDDAGSDEDAGRLGQRMSAGV